LQGLGCLTLTLPFLRVPKCPLGNASLQVCEGIGHVWGHFWYLESS
jgi:hypothetical protein